MVHFERSEIGDPFNMPNPSGPSRRTTLMMLGGTALGAATSSGTSASALSRVPTPPRDLWPQFWMVYDQANLLGTADRASALFSGFFQPRMDVYVAAELKHVTVAKVAEWLTRFDAIASDVRWLHQRFETDYALYSARFRQSFPDFDGQRSPVTLLPSLMNFDAHLAPRGPELPLYFGLDGIVAFHGSDPDLGVLFSHETFHCYQGQKNPGVMLQDKLPVYAGLWIEGGATWVSERLNPKATAKSILLDDRDLSNITPEALRNATRAISGQFDSTSDQDVNAFFTIGYKGDWPARAGYFVGLQIARKVGPTMAIGQFASLPLDRMRPLYRSALDGLMASQG